MILDMIFLKIMILIRIIWSTFCLCHSKNTKPLFIATQTRMTIASNVENLDKIFFKQ